MRPATRPPPTTWASVSHRGRPFLRTALPDSDQDGPAFTIARELANRYQVGALIATGEVAVVLAGRDSATRHDVVIKALQLDPIQPPRGHPDPSGPLADEVRRLRHLLQTERRLLVRLQNAGCAAIAHPNDYVYDCNPGLDAPPFVDRSGRPWLDERLIATEPYLVLRRMPGESLETLLATRFPSGMDEDEALDLIRPIVRTLETLHTPWTTRSGHVWHCVYQDLKPANIIVSPSGRASLLDFGGCQVVIDGVPVLEGARTPGYSPPECEGAGPARLLLPCADVYGLGSTLYHMLTGIDPRDRQRRRHGKGGEPLDAADLPVRVSPALRRVVARCLAGRPSDRFADARQVALALWGAS